jgi:hypothetical protein
MKRPGLCLAVAWTLCTVVAAPPARADSAVGLADYKRTLHQARISLEQAALEPAAMRSKVAQVRRSLLPLGSVRLPDGRIVPTSAPQLALDLAPGPPSAVRGVLPQLRALDTLLAAQFVRGADPRQLRILDDVLRDRRFSTRKSTWELLQDWALNLLARLLAGVADAGGVNGLVAGAVGFACLALIAGIAFLVARRALESIVLDSSAPAGQEPTRADATRTRAGEHADAGDYRLALRYLYLATLLSLQERGILDLQPGLTNGEYLRLVSTQSRDSHALSDTSLRALQQLTDAFDRAWYGHEPVDAPAYIHYRELSKSVLDSPGSSVAA